MKTEFLLQSSKLCICHSVCTIWKSNSLELLLQTGLENSQHFASCLTWGKFPHLKARKSIENYLKYDCIAHSEILFELKYLISFRWGQHCVVLPYASLEHLCLLPV